jgi:hypothetical protein
MDARPGATPNANLPTSGTATFNLIGATSPTLSNGASAPGTLTSGVVNVAWGTVGPNPAIGVNLAGTINGNAFTVTSNLGGIASPSSGITYNAATQSLADCGTSLLGWRRSAKGSLLSLLQQGFNTSFRFLNSSTSAL